MTIFDVAQFTKAFRFHPQAWRDEHLETATGALIDAAEAEGRPYPSVAERMSLYAHAATLWAARFLRPTTRDVVASLAFGTGLALAVVLACLSAAGASPDQIGAPPLSLLNVADLIVPAMWFGAAAMFALRGSKPARRMIGAVPLASTALLVAKLALPQLSLPSGVSLIALSVFGCVALVGRLRARLAWSTAGVVAVLGAIFASWPVVTEQGNAYADSHLWRATGPWLLLAILAFLIALAVCAAAGHRSFAAGGAAYSALWLAFALSAQVHDEQPALTVGVIAAAWVIAAVGIGRLARPSRPSTSPR